jgi:hypothetical protein
MRETAKREIWDIVAGQRVGLQGPRALTEGAGKYCRCHTKTETHPKPMLAIHTRRTLNVHKTARVGRSSKEKSVCTATTEDVHMKCKKSAANPVNKRCAQQQQQKLKGVHTKNRHL